MIRKTIAMALVVSITWISTWAAAPGWAQPDPQSLSQKEALKRLERLMILVEELRTHIDRSQFDLEVLLDRLAYDPEAIVRFVTDEIYFEQYPGLLRGAQGTLLSRAGNSLDQALLMATLLKDAGAEARILRGSLSSSQAARLVQSMSSPRTERPPLGDIEAIKKVLRKMAGLADQHGDLDDKIDRVGQSPTSEALDLIAGSRVDRDFLISQLETAEVELGDPAAMDRIIEEARDYFWVEYRDSASGPWVAVHPAVSRQQSGSFELDSTAIYTSEIPQDLQHRFRFDVVIEQRMGSQISEHYLIENWERPVANLIGEPLTYSNVPDTLAPEADPRELDAALSRSRLFLPLLNVKQRGSLAFDIAGSTAPIDVAASAAAGVFKTSSDKMSAAATALGALGSSDTPTPAMALVQQRLDFRLISPGGEERVFSRNIFRVPSPDPSDPETRRQLTKTHTFMLAPGSFPEAYVLDRALEQLIQNRPMMEVWLKKVSDPEAKVSLPQAELSNVDMRSLDHLYLYTLFDLGAEGDLNYRPEPSLAVISEGLPVGETWERTTDILANHRRAFTFSNGTLEPSSKAALSTGVWETHAEGVSDEEARIKSFNTRLALAKAQEAGIEIATLRPEEIHRVEKLQVSELAKGNLRSDLESGYVVVVPEQTPPGLDGRTGWWRIDPRSGETLGVGDDGRGVDASEMVILLIVLGVLLIAIVAAIGLIALSIVTDAVITIVKEVAFVIHCDDPVAQQMSYRCRMPPS